MGLLTLMLSLVGVATILCLSSLGLMVIVEAINSDKRWEIKPLKIKD